MNTWPLADISLHPLTQLPYVPRRATSRIQ